MWSNFYSFIGELFKRKCISENTTFGLFEKLLGYSNLLRNTDNDIFFDSAIELMDKVGKRLYRKVKNIIKS